jgi:hypothetical protein
MPLRWTRTTCSQISCRILRLRLGTLNFDLALCTNSHCRHAFGGNARPFVVVGHLSVSYQATNSQKTAGDDFDLFDGDRCVGRIFLSPHSPPDRNWMGTIAAREYPPTIHNRGYSPTREQAMAN